MSAAVHQRYIWGWRVLHLRSSHEKTVAKYLQSKGYEAFLPTYLKRRRQPRDAYEILERPLFPGYLFCWCDGSHLSPLLNTPGVVRVLGTRENPAIIDENEIERVRALTRSNLDLQPLGFIPSGTIVQVESGPLRGVEGVIVAPDHRRQKLVVSITMLQRSASVSMDPDWLSTVKTSHDSINRLS